MGRGIRSRCAAASKKSSQSHSDTIRSSAASETGPTRGGATRMRLFEWRRPDPPGDLRAVAAAARKRPRPRPPTRPSCAAPSTPPHSPGRVERMRPQARIATTKCICGAATAPATGARGRGTGAGTAPRRRNVPRRSRTLPFRQMVTVFTEASPPKPISRKSSSSSIPARSIEATAAAWKRGAARSLGRGPEWASRNRRVGRSSGVGG